VQQLERMVKDKNVDRWKLGDLLAQVFPDEGGMGKDGSLAQWCKDHGVDGDKPRQCRALSMMFPTVDERKRYGLSWSYYRAVYRAEDAHDLLRKVVENKWTVRQLRAEIVGVKGEPCAFCKEPIRNTGFWNLSTGKKLRLRVCSTECAISYLTNILKGEQLDPVAD
jgi:hypothetical protein